ncbi:MAG TPA: CHC2 zinc finger domain-containing protein [Planctomycetota bacterium]|nr:CHC2 zinc finger domain-containing protein [Planctomycetota bacterium]
MFNDDLKRRVRDANNILDVVRASVGKLVRAGRNWKACCPFHNEKTASFNVNVEGQYFKCFGCGKSGDVFTFVMLSERCEFPEALKILADKAGIRVESDPKAAEAYQKEKDWKSYLYKLNEVAANFFREKLFAPEGKHALAYLNKRGLNDEICARFGMGYAPSGGSPLVARLIAQKAPAKAILLAGLASERSGYASALGDTDPSPPAPLPQGERGERRPSPQAERGTERELRATEFRATGQIRDFFFDRLMFPIRDMQGRVIAFGGRILGDGEPKYLNTRDTPLFSKTKTVYGIDLAREKILETRKAVLVEGYTDVMMCHQHGVTNVVACLGTAITPEHVRHLRRVADELVMLTDSDAAGARASERSLAVLMAEQMPAKIVRLPGADKDPCDFLLAKGREPFVEALATSTELFDYKFERVMAAHDIRSAIGLKDAAKELMALVSVVPDALLKNEYRRRVSMRLNVAEKDLEFEKAGGGRREEGGGENAGGTPAVQMTGDAPLAETELAKAERELLRFLFHEPAWLETAVTRLDLLALTGKHERILGQFILEAMGEGSLPPDPSIIGEGGASSLVAREVLKKIGNLPNEGTEGLMQVCIELADKGPGGAKIEAQGKFEMLWKPVKKAGLNEQLQSANRNMAHARMKGDEAEEEKWYVEAARLRREMKNL